MENNVGNSYRLYEIAQNIEYLDCILNEAACG